MYGPNPSIQKLLGPYRVATPSDWNDSGESIWRACRQFPGSKPSHRIADQIDLIRIRLIAREDVIHRRQRHRQSIIGASSSDMGTVRPVRFCGALWCDDETWEITLQIWLREDTGDPTDLPKIVVASFSRTVQKENDRIQAITF